MFNTGVLPWPRILSNLSGRLVQGDLALPALGVSTDSRTIQPDNLFVALVGPHFDGRAFVSQAFERGAAGAVVSGLFSWDAMPAQKIIIEVQDTLRALGDLAQLWRRRFSVPVIGLTGSNGKTTTKEMLAGILELTGATLKNPGNLNNLIGLPLTLLGLGLEHRFAVLEMGMNRSGEIRRLSAIAVPTVGLVTNIGPAHLEGLGSLEAIAQAKGELFEALTREDWAVINQDDPRILELSVACQSQKITYGLDPRAEVRAEGIKPTCLRDWIYSLLSRTAPGNPAPALRPSQYQQRLGCCCRRPGPGPLSRPDPRGAGELQPSGPSSSNTAWTTGRSFA